VVLTAVAILTALGVDLAYNTRVSLQIAANARDELRAQYLARSAVNLSRLVIHFQQQLDQAAGGFAAAVAQLPGAQGVAAPNLSLRLWELVPVDSSAAALFLSAGKPAEAQPPPAAGPAQAAASPFRESSRAAGDAEGSFQARMEDEERKVNLPQLAGLSVVAGPQLARLLMLVKDPRYDAIFDREDENGSRFSRVDLAIALKDWVDEDEVTSVLTGNPAVPFEAGFGDENFAYDRGPERYRAKNARFDSLEELFLVSGVSDAFMAAFGDKLTVYPDVNALTNINTTDPREMLVNILVMSDPPGVPQPAVLEPAFPEKLDMALKLARPLPFQALSVQQFAAILGALGVRVQPLFQQPSNTDARNPFGNKSSTFRIRATGKAGGVVKSIEAVVTVDARAGAQANDLGRLLSWREE
jgi:general secretion pathway protein K